MPSASRSPPSPKRASTSSCSKPSATSRSCTRPCWPPATPRPTCPSSPRSPSTMTATALTAPSPKTSAPRFEELGRRCHRLQLLGRPAGHVGHHRTASPRHLRFRSQRSPTPACRAASKDATSTCARRSTWPTTRATSSMPASRLVGGCCGTTPEHIQRMKLCRSRSANRALRQPYKAVADAGGRSRSSLRRWPSAPSSAQSWPTANSSPWSRSCRRSGTDRHAERSTARASSSRVGVDAINIPDSPRASARMSNQACPARQAAMSALSPCCTTPAATATSSASSRTCWAPAPWASTTSSASPAIRPSWATIPTPRLSSTWTLSDW